MPDCQGYPSRIDNCQYQPERAHLKLLHCAGPYALVGSSDIGQLYVALMGLIGANKTTSGSQGLAGWMLYCIFFKLPLKVTEPVTVLPCAVFPVGVTLALQHHFVPYSAMTEF